MSLSWTKQGERYLAARVRPATYPESLPFVADRDVEVMERQSGPDAVVLTARWLVPDADALFSLLVSSSILDGWRIRAQTSFVPPMFCADCMLERNEVARGISITRIDTLAIVTVTDAPTAWMRRQPHER